MKILLLNDNPVVTKLVTLSAQKTDDEVEAAHNLEEVNGGAYDLLVIDDALYSAENFELLKEKVTFKKSLFVCSRENESEEKFSATIKKPFLPTDMVELLTNIKRNLDTPAPEEESVDEMSDEELLEDLELEGLDDLEDLGDLGDDLNLDDDEDILVGDDEELGESVLDDEEAQKVKDLLDETQDEEYEMALDLEDEADVDISEDIDDADLLDLGLDEAEAEEESEVEDISLDEEIDLDLAELELDEELGLEDEEISEEDTLLEEDEPTNTQEDLETQIQDAVEGLSEEDLESEVDEETLLDIANNEIDSFANLNSKDLKAALGEDVDEDDEEENTKGEEPDIPSQSVEEDAGQNRGVDSLKALLKTLSDEKVAASLKGAKITINISFED